MSAKRPTQLQLSRFWSWFVSIAPMLAEDFYNDYLLRELDRHVAALGPVGWEVGPGILEPNQLVISPDGDRALLPLTKLVVGAAPNVPAWEFHWAKPPKQWGLKVSIAYKGEQLSVDIERWRYVLHQFDDGTFNVEIEANTLGPSDMKWAATVGEVVLDSLLGEARRLEVVSSISVVQEISDDSNRASPIAHISAHLDALSEN